MVSDDSSSAPAAQKAQTYRSLPRELGTWGAVMIGMGSIVGTGVFVSIGLAAGVAGPAVLIALVLGAALAACNGLSSAQLAAAHPVAGGTYEYGYRVSLPIPGFMAGWMFLAAKSASAATAALSLAGYLLNAVGGDSRWLVPLALLCIVVVVALVLCGIKRTSAANVAIVSVTLAVLAFFVIAGALSTDGAAGRFTPFFKASAGSPDRPVFNVLYATALMFVAYTGYGRIATLGEEVRSPRRTIPRAVVITLLASMLLYLGVAAVSIAAIGADAFYAATQNDAAPLEIVSRSFHIPGAWAILALGAVTAMTGVLLNLLLGLSRVMLAMGRRRDMPGLTAKIDSRGVPIIATIAVAAIIASMTLIGSVRIAWSLSAFTVLMYYAITNWCALRLPREARLYPRWIAWFGLAGCLGLAAFIEWRVLLAGVAILAAGIAWRFVAHLLRRT